MVAYANGVIDKTLVACRAAGDELSGSLLPLPLGEARGEGLALQGSMGDSARHASPSASAVLLWWLALVCSLLLTETGVALAQGLSCSDQQGKPGDTVSFTIQVDGAPAPVEAFGFDVVYDSNVLRYTQTFQTGELTRRFNFFNVHEASPGRIRVAGFTIADPIKAGSVSPLVTLAFTVANPGNATLSLVNPVDGMAGWPTRAGRFTGEAPPVATTSRPQETTPPASVSQPTGGVLSGSPAQAAQTTGLPATSPVQSSAVQTPASQPQDTASPSPLAQLAQEAAQVPTAASPSQPSTTSSPPTLSPSPTAQTRSTPAPQTQRQTTSPPVTAPTTHIVVPTPLDTGQGTAGTTVSTPVVRSYTDPRAVGAVSAPPAEGLSGGTETDVPRSRQDVGEESKVSAQGTPAASSRLAETRALPQTTEPASQVSQKTAALIPPGGSLPTAKTPASAPAPRAPSSPPQGEPAPAPSSGWLSLNLSVAAVAVAAVMLGIVVVVLVSGRATEGSARRGGRKQGK